jgi:hypothetical protein
MQQEIVDFVEIPDYGWVPFNYFQHILIIILILCSYNYKKINKVLNNFIYDPLEKKLKTNTISRTIKIFIAIIPIIIILYLDIKYSSFSMKNLGINDYISNDILNTLLRLFGGYCIIQVAAQDLGVKTGTVQSDFIKLSFMQVILYVGCAYAITQDRSEAFLAALIYFQLKYFGSNATKDVCFD